MQIYEAYGLIFMVLQPRILGHFSPLKEFYMKEIEPCLVIH